MSWLDTLDDIRTRDFSKVSPENRDKAARDVINLCSYAAAVVSISPIPMSDLVLMLPIQTGMVMTVGHIYGRKVTKASARDLVLELGTTAGLGLLARQGIKALIPIFGALLTVAPAFAANWAMGRVAMEYFKNPGLTGDNLKEVFQRAQNEGSSLFSKDAFDRFRKQNEKNVQAVAEEANEEEAAEEEEAPAPKKAAARKTAKKPLGKAAAKKTTGKRTAAKPSARRASAREEAAEENSEAEGPLSVQRLVERELPRRIEAKPDVARGIQAIVHLDISGTEGGQWTVDLRKSNRWVSPGLKGSPRVTVRCADDDFLKIATGQKDAKMAVFSGSLVFEPLDLELAQQIGQLLA